MRIQDWKKIRSLGEKMSREYICQRFDEILLHAKHDRHYQGLVEAIGRIHFLALCCKADGYWGEKSYSGFLKEQCYQECRNSGYADKEGYVGYCGKIEVVKLNREQIIAHLAQDVDINLPKEKIAAVYDCIELMGGGVCIEERSIKKGAK